MNIEVELGGRRRAWRLLEVGRLNDWFEALPADGGGGAQVLCVPADLRDAYLDRLCDVGRRAARALDDFAVELLPETTCRRGPLAALWEWMGLAPSSRRAAAETLARLGHLRPRLFFALLGPGTDVASWLDELRGTLDLHSKLPQPGPVAFLVLVPGPPPAGNSLRLDFAWPAAGPQTACEDARWTGYLHERVAWHLGGNLQHLGELPVQSRELTLGDDRGLEMLLDEHAGALLRALKLPPGGATLTTAPPLAVDPWLQMSPGLIGPDARALRPVPWLARGLLNAHPGHPERRFLRAVCICRPLANRLLGRCMDLEQRVRDRLLQTPPPWPPSDEAQRQAARLTSEPNTVEHRLTPVGRWPVDDPWELAPFGEVIDTYRGRNRRHMDAMHELRRVRNALAHGTPVGWEAFGVMDRLEDELR